MRNLWFILACLGVFAMLVWFSYRPLVTPSREPARFAAASTPQAQTGDGTAAPPPLRICSDLWLPYAGEAGTDREGYLVDIMRQIYEPLGYRITYYTAPWTRCVQDVREGAADGLVGTVFSETPDLIFPESSLGLDQSMFFTLPDNNWTFRDKADLQKIKLGAVQDYDYNELLDLYIRRNLHTGKIWFARGDNPLDRMVTALQDREIDVFVENQDVVGYFVAQHRGRVRIRKAGPIGPAVRLYAAFSPRHGNAEELARLLDRKIDDLRATGQLQAILDRYGMKDWRQLPAHADKAGVRQ